MSECDFTLILPCYNEAEHLERSFARILGVLDELKVKSEVIFVEDCSTDDTRDILERILSTHTGLPLRVLWHESNTGRGQAVADGIREARGDIVGFIDVDLEVGAHYIVAHLAAIRAGADMTIASRVYKLERSLLLRHVLSRVYRATASRVLGMGTWDSEAGYKFFRRERILPVLNATENKGWFWDTEIVARAEEAGLELAEVASLFLRRRDKTSTVRLIRDSVEYARALWRFRMSRHRKRR